MRWSNPVLFLTVGVLACLIEFGCAGNVPNNPPGALNIAQFNLSGGALGVPYRQLLVASGGKTPYTWTISSGSLPPGLTVTTDGIISGTPVTDSSCASYPCTYNFTVKVTDSQTPTAAYDTANLSIVINKDLSLSPETLPTATANEAYSETIMASNGVAPYTYAVYGSSQLPAGLTLSTIMPMNNMANGASIMGTPTAAGTYTFTIQATDSVQETATATFTLTVMGILQGPYAITLNGFQNGQPFYLVGSIVAGGPTCTAQSCTGSITSGIIDQNGPGSTISTDVQVMPSSSYTIPTASNFGTISLVTSLGTYNFNVVISTINDSRLMLSNTNPNMYGSGLLKKQASTVIPNDGGNYSFGLYGNDSTGARYAAAGMFVLNNSLAVTAGAIDINDNGTVPGEQFITGGSFSNYDPNSGRGTATLTVGSATYNYAFYIVSGTEFVGIDTDAGGPATIVDIQEQQTAGAGGGGIVLCKSGTACQNVLELDGTNTNNTVAEAEIGVMSVDGGGNITRTDGLPAYYLDQNNGGTLGSIQYTSGTYSIDPTCGTISTPCGRITVNLTGATNQPVWYLVTTGQAFFVGTDPDVTQGTVQPQSGSPFLVSGLLGSYLGGTISPTIANINNEIDVAITPPPGGTWDLQSALSGPNGTFTNQVLSIPYTFDSVYGAPFGRFNLCDTAVTPANCDSTMGNTNLLSILYLVGGGSGAGTTGGKGGLAVMNVGVPQANGTSLPDPNPRLTLYGH